MKTPKCSFAAVNARSRQMILNPSIRTFGWKRFIAWALMLGIVLNLLPQAASFLFAQASGPTLAITGIDTSSFPQVKVTVYGEGLDGGLAKADISVLEDNVPQTITASPMITVGTQTLLVLDSYAQINEVGLTNDPPKISRKDEVVRAVQQLTASGYSAALTANTDWLGFVTFDNSGAAAVPKVFEPWNKEDHNKVINGVVKYDTKTAKSTTPLSDLLFTAIRYFDDKTPPPNLQRSIVVFSDGFDFENVANPNDIIREANDRRVRVHTVQVGSTNKNAQRFLQNLSLNTGGQSFSLNASNKLLDSLWQTIKVTEQQREFTYRTTKSAPQQITVSAKAGTSKLDAKLAFPAFSVLPPKVTIVNPDFASLERKLADGQVIKSTTPLTDLEPNTLTIRVTLAWPDNHERKLQRVEYIVNDKTFPPQPAEPTTSLDFPIESLDAGDYTIRVRVTDELGLVAESDPKPLTIVIKKPVINAEATATAIQAEKITATVEAKATATVIAGQQAKATVAQATATAAIAKVTVEAANANWWGKILTIATSVSSLVALIALILVIILWRNPRVRKRATEFATGTFKAATEMFVLGRSSKGVSNTVKARLRYEEGSSSSEQTIDIYGGSVRIGRDPALVNVTLNDRRVSRLHCRISEEANGTFRIWDEGSSSGTYVNQEQVEMSGRILQLGDVVNIGPVQYRFEPLVGSDSPVTEINSNMYGSTQPYILTPNMKDGKTKTYDAKATQIASPDDATNYDTAEPYPGAKGSDDATKYYTDDDPIKS